LLIVRSEGRLGNQLFVYSACQKVLNRREKIVLVGFEDLVRTFPEVLDSVRHFALPRSHWWRWNTVERILRGLARLRLAQKLTLSENHSHLRRTPGLRGLVLFDGGFCQDQRLVDRASILTLRDNALYESSEVLESWGLLSPTSPATRKYFVHVRRGDYLTHPSAEFPAALPAAWFRSQIERLQEKDSSAQFLVFTDDIPFCTTQLGGIPDVAIVEAEVTESFLAMSLCAGGILSASSLSWWAAFLASDSAPGPFVAPQYWINWRKKSWGDERVGNTSFFEWHDASESLAKD